MPTPQDLARNENVVDPQNAALLQRRLYQMVINSISAQRTTFTQKAKANFNIVGLYAVIFAWIALQFFSLTNNSLKNWYVFYNYCKLGFSPEDALLAANLRARVDAMRQSLNEMPAVGGRNTLLRLLPSSTTVARVKSGSYNLFNKLKSGPNAIYAKAAKHANLISNKISNAAGSNVFSITLAILALGIITGSVWPVIFFITQPFIIIVIIGALSKKKMLNLTKFVESVANIIDTIFGYINKALSYLARAALGVAQVIANIFSAQLTVYKALRNRNLPVVLAYTAITLGFIALPYQFALAPSWQLAAVGAYVGGNVAYMSHGIFAWVANKLDKRAKLERLTNELESLQTAHENMLAECESTALNVADFEHINALFVQKINQEQEIKNHLSSRQKISDQAYNACVTSIDSIKNTLAAFITVACQRGDDSAISEAAKICNAFLLERGEYALLDFFGTSMYVIANTPKPDMQVQSPAASTELLFAKQALKRRSAADMIIALDEFAALNPARAQARPT